MATSKKPDGVRECGTEAFVSFFVHYCLRNLFKSKKEMALALGIGYQTILLVTNKYEKYKGASLVFQELVAYCIDKDISLDEIAKAFLLSNDADCIKPKCVLQEPSCFVRCQTFCGVQVVGELKEGRSPLIKAHRFMVYMRLICCKDCMVFWKGEDSGECLIHQTMGLIVQRLRKMEQN